MSKFLSAFAGLSAVAIIALASPVIAQPLRIVVTDPGLIEPVRVPSVRYVLPSRLFNYHLEFGTNFDPAKAAMDSQFLTSPTPSINLVRAEVVEYHGESLAEHQLRCQAMHASYEPAGDTYLGRDGIPRPCSY